MIDAATFAAISRITDSHLADGCRLYKPYPKVKLFHDLGARFDVRCLSGGNRVGKTLAFYSGELAFHLTGEYPDWWEGRRWNRPVSAWVGSEDWATNVEGCQQRLVGDVSRGRMGLATVDDVTGEMIPCGLPLDRIEKVVRHSQVAGALTEVIVRHISGGLSRCRFIAYSKGRAALQAGKIDIAGMDEEPPEDVATELMARTMDSRGMSVLTFTPLKGVSAVVQRFIGEVPLNDEFPHVLESSIGAMVRVEATDAPHLTPDIVAKMKREYPKHEHMARIKGIPALGEGAVFPFPDEAIEIAPFTPQFHWKVCDAVDFGIQHPTTRCRVVLDPDTGTFYVTQTYRVAGLTPTQHAINWDEQFAGRVPVAWPGDGRKREEDTDTAQLISLRDRYRKLGVMMLASPVQLPTGGNSLEGSIGLMYEAMQSGRWRVFTTCPDWFAEKARYRREKKGDLGRAEIVKVFDDVLDASRYAMMQLLCGGGVTIAAAFSEPETPLERRRVLEMGLPLSRAARSQDQGDYGWTPGQ